jgi:phage antirepressor YoqD-like protein
MTNVNQHSKKFEHHSKQQHGNNAMNLSTQTQQTMLSTEIVKIINDMREEGTAVLEHKNFMAKVVRVLGEDLAAKFSAARIDSRGKEQNCYALPKREAELMVMSESYKVQAAVYDRMTELEQQATKLIDPMQVLNDPAAMRGLLLTYAETVIEKDKVIAEQAPKVAALARLSESDGSLCLTDAAKTLNIQPKKFIQSLSAKRWIYKRTGSDHWVAYQDKLQSGVLEHKVKTVHRNDGSEKITEQARITPKGLTKLAVIFSSGAGDSK